MGLLPGLASAGVNVQSGLDGTPHPGQFLFDAHLMGLQRQAPEEKTIRQKLQSEIDEWLTPVRR